MAKDGNNSKKIDGYLELGFLHGRTELELHAIHHHSLYSGRGRATVREMGSAGRKTGQRRPATFSGFGNEAAMLASVVSRRLTDVKTRAWVGDCGGEWARGINEEAGITSPWIQGLSKRRNICNSGIQ